MDYILSHYINPHLFWLRSVHPTSTKGSNFEGQFDEYYKLNAESEVHVAHLEEVGFINKGAIHLLRRE